MISRQSILDRLFVERDGETHLRVMKGLELTKRQTAFAAFLLVVAFVLPDIALVVPFISFGILYKGLLFGLAALGLNLLLRHTELVSFGHAAFFGGGAYAVAVLAVHYDVTSVFVLLFGAVFVSSVLAIAIGYLVSGHLDIYFALLTLAFNQVLYAIVFQSGYFNYNDGLAVRPDGGRPLLFGTAFDPDPYRILVYYLSLVLVILGLLIMWRFIHSPFGRALDAIGQNRTRAEFVGIPVERYVWLAFIVSGVYGGVAGGLYALLDLHVRPEPTLYVFRSGEILFMAILGGFNTLLGPIVGGIVLVYLLDLARFYTDYFNLLTGAVLLTVVYFFPRGIMGSLPEFRAALAEFREDRSMARDIGGRMKQRFHLGVKRSAESLRVILFGVR